MANKKGAYDLTKKACDTKEIRARTLTECPNIKGYPIGKYGPLVAKIPVVIAEPKIQIVVEADIKLDEPALEIKRIKKDLFLTQCRLITIRDGVDGRPDERGWHEKTDDKCGFGKLFLSGFVRKNIEYATLDGSHSGGGCLSGNIRHATCNIPFECATQIDFINSPEKGRGGFTTEFETFSSDFKSCSPCEHPILGHDPCEQEFEHFEQFTEKVFCELESAHIFEADILKDGAPWTDDCSCEYAFQNFTEKMVIFLTIKLLQNQQVKIDHH